MNRGQGGGGTDQASRGRGGCAHMKKKMGVRVSFCVCTVVALVHAHDHVVVDGRVGRDCVADDHAHVIATSGGRGSESRLLPGSRSRGSTVASNTYR